MTKKTKHQFCSAGGWADTALKNAQWLIENGLTAISLVVESAIRSGQLGYWAYILHLIGMVLYPEQRPRNGIDWFTEILNWISFAESVLIIFGVTISPIILQLVSVVTLVLLFATIANKLTA